MASWFDEVITPTERKEVEEAVRRINFALLRGRLVCQEIKDLIKMRFNHV